MSYEHHFCRVDLNYSSPGLDEVNINPVIYMFYKEGTD